MDATKEKIERIASLVEEKGQDKDRFPELRALASSTSLPIPDHETRPFGRASPLIILQEGATI